MAIDETYVRELEARVRNAEARAEKSENSAHDGWAEVERVWIDHAEVEQLKKEIERLNIDHLAAEKELEEWKTLSFAIQAELQDKLSAAEKERDEARGLALWDNAPEALAQVKQLEKERDQAERELEKVKLDRNYALADFLQCKLALDVAEKERNEAVAERDAARNEFLRLMRENTAVAKERDEARTAERAATEAWKRLLGDEAAARAEVEKLRDVLASKHGGEPEALLRELDEARAEVARLKKEVQEANLKYLSLDGHWSEEQLRLTQEVERLRAKTTAEALREGCQHTSQIGISGSGMHCQECGKVMP